MRTRAVVLSSASPPRRFSTSPAIVATCGSALRVSTGKGAMIATAASVLLRSDRVGRLPPLRTATRPALSTGTRARLSLGPAATRGLPAACAEPTLLSPPSTAAPRDRRGTPPLHAIPTAAGESAPPEAPGELLPEAQDSVEAAAAAKPVKPPRIEMTIDSLPSYDLLQPIPVIIEPLDDRTFKAEAPALQISASGSSIGGSFLQLKEQIAATYEQCRQKSTLTPERLRQLGLFQAYIGKAKRSWSLGRG